MRSHENTKLPGNKHRRQADATCEVAKSHEHEFADHLNQEANPMHRILLTLSQQPRLRRACNKTMLLVIAYCFALSICPHCYLSAQDWMQWRGPLMTGEAPDGDPPISWSEKENVEWKTSLDGLGHSSPVVANGRVFLTFAREIGQPFEPRPDTAPGAHDNKLVSSEFEFVAAAYSLSDGKQLWEKVLHKAIPHEGAHISGSLASASPVTDGKHVWFFFGSYGLYCLDFQGVTKWKKNLGKMNTKHGHGEGATPVLHQDILAVNWDHEGQSYTVALNKNDGEEIWKNERDEVTSWSSPIVVEEAGQQQLIVAGTTRIRAYELETGNIIWQCGGMSQNIVASPVAADGMVFVGSSYEKRQMLGIRLKGAKGDITSTDHVVWSRTARTPYVPSLLLVEGHIYFLRHYQGIMSRVAANNGEEPSGPFRIHSMNEIYASPVAANGRIYITDRSGTTAVLSTDPAPKDFGVNRLNDRFSASAAIVGKRLILRGEKNLYCIANAKAKALPNDKLP